MEPVPQTYIDEIPESVEADRKSCEEAADAALLALFFLASQNKEDFESFPLIISNNASVWKLPAPWTGAEENTAQLLRNLNGVEGGTREGFLAHAKKNCAEFNEALASNDLPLANRIIAVTPGDCASIWNDCNALAFNTEQEGTVYRPLTLSEGTKAAFKEI